MKTRSIRCVGLAIYALDRVGTDVDTMLRASATSITSVIRRVGLEVAAMSNGHPKTKRTQSMQVCLGATIISYIFRDCVN